MRTLASLAFAIAMATHASSAHAGAIGGRVTGDGEPVEDICVGAFTAADLETAGTDLTDASGLYEITDLDDGAYKIHFFDCITFEEQPTWASEWYDDRASFEDADVVTVSAGERVEGIDADLVAGGRIHGTVTRADTGEPFGGVLVFADEPSTHAFGFDITDADGIYDLGGLPTGSYLVYFDPGRPGGGRPRVCENRTFYDWEIYDDVKDPDEATPVPVTAGQTTAPIDAALDIAPSSDLVVTAVDVTNLGGDSTSLRRIDVTVTNEGAGASDLALIGAEVCGATGADVDVPGGLTCSRIGESAIDLAPGAGASDSFTWDPSATLSVGDVVVRGRAWVSNDEKCSNNRGDRADSVLVSGTGVGVSVVDP